MTYAVLGFMVALLAIMMLAVIWQWAKGELERWGYNLTRESRVLLHEMGLKLDSIQTCQERLLSRLERLSEAPPRQFDRLREEADRNTSRMVELVSRIEAKLDKLAEGPHRTGQE
jgi:hypothetical protein